MRNGVERGERAREGERSEVLCLLGGNLSSGIINVVERRAFASTASYLKTTCGY